MDFLEWKWKNSDSNFTEGVQLTINSSIGSDNGLAPTRRQAIIWTNVDPVHRRIYAALGGDELMHAHEKRYRELIFSLNTNGFLCADTLWPSQYKNTILPIHLTIMKIVGHVERPEVYALGSLRNHFFYIFLPAHSDKTCCQKQIHCKHGHITIPKRKLVT